MKRVKLLSVWFGPLPAWFDRFKERMTANRLIDWELIQPPSVGWMNDLASDCTGVLCRKGSAYTCCDLRPLYAELFPASVAGYEWWGWCDLDIVAGDLDTLLPPLLENNDVVSAEPFGTAGCMTLLRNTRSVNELYRAEEALADVLADPGYRNFDETGGRLLDQTEGGGPSLTWLLKVSGLRCHFDDRSWSDSWHLYDDGRPSRLCRISGKKVVEVPAEDEPERELLLYHFSKGKAWPI